MKRPGGDDSNHGQPVAENLLKRDFTAEKPNQRWVGDTTELRTPHGKLYLAVILDLFSRFVVGWALRALNDRHVTMKALDMALRRRSPDDDGLLHHSDQDTCACEDYQDVLDVRGIMATVSSRPLMGSGRRPLRASSSRAAAAGTPTALRAGP